MGLHTPVRYALATGAGKDATLALHRARASGLNVTHALCIYDHDSGRVRFHGTRRELVEAQAAALGLELLALPCAAGDFERVFTGALSDL
jgi:diphthamide synthase (EF-2-diphthine--ammonia ligase)